ncbi:MAG: arylsulfatase [Pseudomonadota bacterium]
MRKLAALAGIGLIAGIGVWAMLADHRAPIPEAATKAVLAMKAGPNAQPLDSAEPIAAPNTQPNIILIVADDLGWRDVGYNVSEIRTPVIDRLAGEGLTLNRFYAWPSCSPTRAALMTGKSPMRLGVFAPLSKLNPTGLPIDEETLADRLKAAGYQTALVGKWHLGPRNLAYHPNNRGFDHFYGHLTGGVGYYDKVHGGGYDWQRNGVTVRDDHYATHLVADEAIRVIEDRDTVRPLFLYAAFGAPHLPNEAPEEALSAYGDIDDPNRRAHAAMVSELDAAIGRIHAALAQQGLDESTVIWFLSDNGGLYPSNPARHLPDFLIGPVAANLLSIKMTPRFLKFVATNLRDGGSDNRPFAGGKQSVAEGGVRVPSFVRWPGRFAPQRYNHMVTVQDVAPTLTAIAGAPVGEDHFDGRNVWSALRTNTPAAVKDYIVATRTPNQSDALYRYPHKLIEDARGQRLYNLEDDPLETRDLAGSEPEIVARLSTALAEFPRGENVAIPLQEVVDDPDFFGGKEDREPWAEQAYSPEDTS